MPEQSSVPDLGSSEPLTAAERRAVCWIIAVFLGEEIVPWPRWLDSDVVASAREKLRLDLPSSPDGVS